MRRVRTQRLAEEVANALLWLPPRLAELAACDVFEGDPIFSGLHNFESTGDARSYRHTAHACFPWHVNDRRVTVVLPESDPPCWYTLIHELGHVIDHALLERSGRWGPKFAPVTEYAETSDREAFAEAFAAWFYPSDEPRFRFNRESREFFDRLAAGSI